MASKFIVFSALLVVANAGALHHPVTYTHIANPAVDAVASTHQNVVRTHDGTVSEYSKNIETPYFSVHKSDKRISNQAYTPIVEKTMSDAAPAVTKTVVSSPTQAVYEYHESTHPTYSHAEYQPTAAVYTHAAPVSKSVAYVAPAVAKSHSYAAPTHVYQHHHHQEPMKKVVQYVAPAPAVYHHHSAPAPAVYHHSAPAPVTTTTYNHGPAASTYTHNSPGVAAYGSSQTVHYSPAEMVSHMSFDGFGTHWGY